MGGLMSIYIESKNALDPAFYIGYQKGAVLKVNHAEDTADIEIDGKIHLGVPVFYNCAKSGSIRKNGALKNSSLAVTRGDEVIVRTDKGKPSHITGFTDGLWPCIKTPAYVFSNAQHRFLLDEKTLGFSKIDADIFDKRYKPVSTGFMYNSVTTYINDPEPDISEGFCTVQTHWTDSRMHRKTDVFFNGNKIYSTFNSETSEGVFSGTRSNIFGVYIHPLTDWGCMVYQVNTFYGWMPQASGRVVFDFYMYTSTGTHTKLCSAQADISGEISAGTGEVLRLADVRYITGEDTGEMLTRRIQISEAGNFSSDGSTNYISPDSGIRTLYSLTEEGADKPYDSIFQLSTDSSRNLTSGDESFADTFDIYVKDR